MNISFVIGLLLANPLSIIANVLTPGIQNWWARTNSARKQKRIAKLRKELDRLLCENSS
jgi:hypothetical protein